MDYYQVIMIDNKKIEDAAKSLRKDFNDDVTQGFLVEFGFEKGAKWAINEFLKDLWHSPNEIPEIGRILVMENHYCGGRIVLHSCIRCGTFHNPLEPTTQKWFYLDDLFPKQKGE